MDSAFALLKRAIRGGLTVVATFTVSFLVLAFVENPNAGRMERYAPRTVPNNTEPRLAAQSEPLLSQYVDWAIRVFTLDLGSAGGIEFSALIAEAVAVTLLYLLPAAVVGVTAGTLVQLLSVAAERRDLTKKTTLLGAVAIAIPVFLIAVLFNDFLPEFVYQQTGSFPDIGYDPGSGPFSTRNLRAMVWPFMTMAFFLFAIQFRAAGTDLKQYAGEPFVKTARAKGVGLLGICRHVFPHSAARLLTLLSSEVFGLVLVGLYAVEWVTFTPGFGALTIDAIGTRHPGLVFGVILLPVVVVVTVNFLQDAYYTLIDPRTATNA
jgi:peptide/nickel transport system permease protein